MIMKTMFDIDINELIRERKSAFSFSAEPVETDKLHQLFEAARWAPSSYNEQPWRFIVGEKYRNDDYARLFDCLFDGNQLWAGQAPVLILSLAKTAFSHNQKPNRHAFHDLGLAVGNLSLQATDLGLALHQMGGFDREKARRLYDIPAEYEPAAMIALGYPGDQADVPPPLRNRAEKPRIRKPLNALVFSGGWEQPASLTTEEC